MDVTTAAALLDSGVDIGLPEVLDIALLASLLPAAADPAPGPVPGSDPADPPAGTVLPPSGRTPAGQADPDLYVREAAPALTAVDGVTKEVPAPAAQRVLPDSLGLGRALRSVRRSRPSPVRTEVDDVRTAEWTAATGMVLPVCRAAAEPYYELAMVCDTGTSMDLWDQLLRETARAAARHGAFRSVTTRRLRSDGGRTALLGPTGEVGLGELVEPNGQRIVAFFTDGVNRGWHDGSMAEQAHRLAGYGPVLVVHLLPPHLWARTGVDPLPVDFRPAPPGGTARVQGFDPVGGWELADLWPYGEPPGGGEPRAVPVVSLTAGPLGSWASLLTGGHGRPVPGAAWIVGPRETAGGGRTVPAAGPAAGRRRADDAALLREFDATATPRARQLLRYLSMAPLNLSTMWLVHTVTSTAAGLPCDPAPLAEVFLSGLLRKRPAGAGQEDAGYEFLGELRQLLFEGLDRDEAVRIFTVVSDHVTRQLGVAPLAFPALLASPGRRDLVNRIDPEARPLARIAVRLLRGLGPAYARAVAAIEDAMRTQPPKPAAEGVPTPVLVPVPVPVPDSAPVLVPGAAEPAGGARPVVPLPVLPVREDRRIAVLGAPASGKTSFLGAAWTAAVRASAAGEPWGVVADDDAAERFIVRQTNHLTTRRRFPDATITSVAFSYHFRAGVPGPVAATGTGSRRLAFRLDFFDAGGSEFGPRRYGADARLAAHLSGARRLLYLVDPFGAPGQSDYLRPHLEQLTHVLRGAGRLASGRLPHHVAFCISKFDQPKLFRLARAGGWVNQNAEGDPCVLPEDAGPFARWLAGRSPEMADVCRLAADHFLPDRVSWFALSSIGFHRRPDGSIDLDDCSNEAYDEQGEPVLRSPARPLNVLEPLTVLGLAPDED